jgi:hypothetical protein
MYVLFFMAEWNSIVYMYYIFLFLCGTGIWTQGSALFVIFFFLS